MPVCPGRLLDGLTPRDAVDREAGRGQEDYYLEQAKRRVDRATLMERGEDEDAEAVLEVLKATRADRERAALRLEAAQDALTAAAVDGSGSDDLWLDFFNGLRAELAGRINNASGDVRRLNAALREFFDAVELTHVEGGVEMLPVLSESAYERLLQITAQTGSWEAWPQGHVAAETPPLRGIRADAQFPHKGW